MQLLELRQQFGLFGVNDGFDGADSAFAERLNLGADQMTLGFFKRAAIMDSAQV